VELDGVSLHMTSGVEDVTLPLLETVHGSIYFHQNTDVTTVDFPVLRSVGGYAYFHDNDSLLSAAMPSLETVGEYFYLYGNGSIEALDLTDSLVAVAGYISITDNPELCVPDIDWDEISDSVSFSGNGECETVERECGREVSGVISDDERWTSDEGSVHIVGSLMIMEGAELIIEPGVRVCFARDQSLTVAGSLHAEGSALEPIEFTSDEAPAESGHWGTINVLPTATDAVVDATGAHVEGVLLKHAFIEYGGGGDELGAVTATNAAIHLDSVNIEDSASSAVAIIGESGDGLIPSSWIVDSVLHYNGGHGLYVDAYRLRGAVSVVGSELSHNGANGISTGGGDAGGEHVFEFSDNRIEDNGGSGIWGGANGTQTISGNTVVNNGSHGIHTRGNGTYTVTDNTVTDNGGRGLFGLYATHIWTGNEVLRNSGGIEVSQGGGFTIENNTISDNTAADGAAIQTETAWSPDVYVRNNLIEGNTCEDSECAIVTIFDPESGSPVFDFTGNALADNAGAYWLRTSRGVSVGAVDATGNDWGTEDCGTIDAMIYDFFDDSGLAWIDYGDDACEESTDPPPACPGGTAVLETPEDVWEYSGCTELDGVSLHMVAGVTDVTLPLLETVEGSIYFHETVNVENVDFPVLRSVSGYAYFHINDRLHSVSMPSLETVGEYLYFNGNESLETVVLTDALTSVGAYVHVVGSPLLCAPDLEWDSISDSVSLSGLAECGD